MIVPRAVSLLCVGLALSAGCDHGASSSPPPRPRLSVTAVLGGEALGFARAEDPRAFVFPRDHAEHSDYRNEWWYLTGHLVDADGHDFGYQLTFFRTGLAAEAPQRESAWAPQSLYMGHFAISDISAQRFYFAERFARGALGLAGTTVAPFSVWLEGWRIDAVPTGPVALPAGPAATGLPVLRLRASEDDFAIDLRVQATKRVVAQGDRGLSRKGASPGNASYYYSFTRLQTSGVMHVDGLSREVSGSSWLDREWSTSALEPDQLGWDWFSLQMSDGRELMIYLMRRNNGTNDPLSSGTLVRTDGTSVHLRNDDFDVDVLDQWRSAEGVSYPSRWRLRVPSIALDVEVEPMLADQELAATFRYWEGIVRGSGVAAGEAITARGFVELTGYDGG